MTHKGWVGVLLAALLLGHAPLHAQEAGVTSALVPVGMVWWPADPGDALQALVSDTEACLAIHIQEAAPEVVLTRQRAIRDALFPLLEPATQPADEAAFAALLGREEVRARLARLGLRYLVAFTGGTRKAEPEGMILCGGGFGAGGCFGFSWQDESTQLEAALWSLEKGRNVRREAAQAEGSFVMPAFVLPVPIPARSHAAACRELGGRIGAAIWQAEAKAAGQGQNPPPPAPVRDGWPAAP